MNLIINIALFFFFYLCLHYIPTSIFQFPFNVLHIIVPLNTSLYLFRKFNIIIDFAQLGRYVRTYVDFFTIQRFRYVAKLNSYVNTSILYQIEWNESENDSTISDVNSSQASATRDDETGDSVSNKKQKELGIVYIRVDYEKGYVLQKKIHSVIMLF